MNNGKGTLKYRLEKRKDCQDGIKREEEAIVALKESISATINRIKMHKRNVRFYKECLKDDMFW